MFTIKKICVLVSISLLLPGFLYAQAAEQPGRTYGFSISPLFGIIYGQAEEIVYRSAASNDYLSELLWDLKPLLYTGFAADFGPKNPFLHSGFFAAASVKFGLPLRTGFKENRDWFNETHNHFTNFSRHEAFSRNAILLDISAGVSWRLSNSLVLRTFAEFTFMHFSWSAENGFAQHPAPPWAHAPPWNENLPKTWIHGPVVLYRQNWFILSPGISLKARPGNAFSIEGKINYSPLIYCRARDDHLLRDTIFFDEMFFGHYINGEMRFIFSPRKNLDLSFSASYRFITGTRGNTYMERTGVNIIRWPVRHYNTAGAGYSALDLGLRLTVRIN